MRVALVFFLFLILVFSSSAQSPQAETWLEHGHLLVEEKAYVDAIKKYEKSAKAFRKLGDRVHRIQALLEISKTYLLLDDNFEAQKMARQVLTLTTSKDTLTASAFQLLGDVETNNARFKKALVYYQKALRIRQQKLPEHHLATAESFQAIGTIYNHLGEVNLAFENLHQALAINHSVLGEQHLTTAETLGALGMVYSTQGDQDQAIKFLQQAIDIFKKLQNEERLTVTQSYFNLGNAFIAKGSYDLGMMNTQRGLTILEGLKGTENPARAPFLNNLGKIYAKRGDYAQALQYYQQALELMEFHKGERYPEVAVSYHNIAEVLSAKSQPDSALVYLKKSLELNEILFDENHPKVAQNWSDIGEIYFELGIYDKALAYFNNAFTKFEEFHGSRHVTIAKIEQLIGKTFLKKGGIEIALLHFQNALNANVPYPYQATDFSENPPLDKIMDENIFLSTLALKSQTLTKLFLSEEKFPNLKLSYDNFLICDYLIDNIRRSFIDYNDLLIFNRIASQVYEEAIYTCMILKNQTQQEGYVEQAFYFSEKSKSNALLQSFTNEEALRFADLPDSLEAQEIFLKVRVSFAQKQLMNALQAEDSVKTTDAQELLLKAKGAYNNFVTALENDYPNYYQLKYDKSVATLKQVQATIENGTTLIDFMSGEKRIFVFGISSNEAFVDLVNKPEEYDDLITNFRKSVTDIGYITHRDSSEHAWQTYTSTGFQLYEILLKTTLEHFPKKAFQKLVIIPDGMLGYLPFEILLKEKPARTPINYGDLDYLVHNYSISYAFSGTMLLKQQEAAPFKTLEYGGFAPLYSSRKMSFASTSNTYQYIRRERYIDLPASRSGVEYISELLGGEAFLGERATEAIFKDTSYHFDILHLAMHGMYDDKDPLNSHLVFTQAEEGNEDNYLTAAELYNMNINASLVFLGACNSGFGKINRGEGIMSLSRAFAYAGCPSIVMSLWSVPDIETASITNHFFQQLKNGVTKDAALRQAKLQYLNDSNIPPSHQHPLFWAGFVPIGDMTPLYAPHQLSNNWTLFAAISMLAITILMGWLLWKRFVVSRM